MADKVWKSEAEWKTQLTPEQFKVARKRGTERAFTGEYLNNHAKGMYNCVCCGMPLFASDTKFDSGSGWPSFWKPVAPENVREEDDISLRRRFLHGQIEILRATRYARLRDGTLEVSDLARVLTTRARPQNDGQA